MTGILAQLGLDQTFFIQIVIFSVTFFLLKRIYFVPFLKLFEARHQRTVADAEAASKMMTDADAKFEEYRARLGAERAAIRKEYEEVLNSAKKEEAQAISAAREQAKKITQEAVESITQQQAQLKKQLEGDVERFATEISTKLLARNG